MNALVGYTGFVGSNLCAKGDFDAVYNSRNIGDAYGTRPDLLIYAGLRAEKYLANHEPEKDLQQIHQAQENIERIAPHRLVLISTIDVIRTPKGVDETMPIEEDGLQAYGLHRLYLEQWARSYDENALIIRLPALFGQNIKKNFIYDYIHVIPTMLTEAKMEDLTEKESDIKTTARRPCSCSEKDSGTDLSLTGYASVNDVDSSDRPLKEYYILQDNGFWKVRALNASEEKLLKGKFASLGFSALNFTDSRSRYQFYNLAELWDDISVALQNGITLWHPATEPVSAGELYEYLTGKVFVNYLSATPADYDYRTVHADLFGGQNGYIADKTTVMRQIRAFVERQTTTG